MTELEIKAAVRERDGHKCRDCGMTEAMHQERYARTLHVHRLVPGSRYSVAGAVAVCYGCHGRRHQAINGPRVSVPIERSLARQVKAVAGARGIPVAVYLSRLLEPIIDRDLELHWPPPKSPPRPGRGLKG